MLSDMPWVWATRFAKDDMGQVSAYHSPRISSAAQAPQARPGPFFRGKSSLSHSVLWANLWPAFQSPCQGHFILRSTALSCWSFCEWFCINVYQFSCHVQLVFLLLRFSMVFIRFQITLFQTKRQVWSWLITLLRMRSCLGSGMALHVMADVAREEHVTPWSAFAQRFVLCSDALNKVLSGQSTSTWTKHSACTPLQYKLKFY